MSKKNVLFLGAGFSYDVGLPTMSNFGKESQRSFKGISKHSGKGGNPRLAADVLMGAAEKFHQFQEVCKNSPALTGTDVDNMETVFCIAEAISESGEEQIKLSDKFYDVNELIRSIQLWLWKIYQQFPPLNPERKAEVKEEVYKNIFKLLSPENTTIITTNYDLVFESYSLSHNIPCFYPIESAEEISIATNKNKYVTLNKNERSDGFTICKLHGSINYFYRNHKEKQKIYVSNELGDETKIGLSGVWKNMPVIFAVDAIEVIKKKFGLEIIPAIVPPTYAKFTQETWLREIWNAAFKAMREAEKIIFIGYSMPESDGFMKALFNGALATRQKPGNPNVYLIDPSGTTFSRHSDFWKDIFDKTRGPISLSEAVKDYLPKIL